MQIHPRVQMGDKLLYLNARAGVRTDGVDGNVSLYLNARAGVGTDRVDGEDEGEDGGSGCDDGEHDQRDVDPFTHALTSTSTTCSYVPGFQ